MIALYLNVYKLHWDLSHKCFSFQGHFTYYHSFVFCSYISLTSVILPLAMVVQIRAGIGYSEFQLATLQISLPPNVKWLSESNVEEWLC